MKRALLTLPIFILGFNASVQAQSSLPIQPILALQSLENEDHATKPKSTFSAANMVFKAASFTSSLNKLNLTTYINQHLHYPQEIAKLGLSGTVSVSFDILPNGSLTNIAILESPNQAFDVEVIRLLKAMPAWKPALAGTLPIKSKQQLRVHFSLR